MQLQTAIEGRTLAQAPQEGKKKIAQKALLRAWEVAHLD
jgi:hypothetical protein